MFDLLNSPWRQLRVGNRTALPVLSPLRLGYLEAGFNGLSSAVTAPLIVPFAVTLGAQDWQIGVITALPLLGMNLVQVPASRLHTRWGNPSLFLLLAGGLGRLAWLALAISMLLGAASYPLLLAAVTAAAVSSGLQNPVWTAFLGQQVPEERRGAYFGTRNLLAGTMSLGGAFGAAWVVAGAGFQVGNGLGLLVAVLAASLAVGTQALAAASWRPGASESPAVRVSRDSSLRQNRPVRSYVIYGALLILGAGMATPFYSVEFINRLGGSPQTAATAIAVAGALVSFGQGLWGWVMDRWGLRLVGGISVACIALVPVMWLVATSPVHGVAIWLFNGFMWAACGLATFNLMLSISNDSNRASVVAWVNTLQSPFNFAAPLLGGLLANAAGAPLLFGLSAVALAASWVYFLTAFPRGEGEIGGA